MAKNRKVIIVGGGAMAMSSAWHLSKLDFDIEIIEQYEVSNPWNASQDMNKVFRSVYADNTFYTALVQKARPYWAQLERESGLSLLQRTGVLLLGTQSDSFLSESYQALQKHGLAVDALNESALRHRFPQFRSTYGVYEQEAGYIRASDTVTALRKAIGDKLLLREHTKVVEVGNGSVRLENGQVLTADFVIVCAGSWVSKLIDIPVLATYQPIIYIEPKQKADFDASVFPVFAYLNFGYYGFPLFDNQSIKVSTHAPGVSVDPDDKAMREVKDSFVASCYDFFDSYIPALKDAKLVDTKVCLYAQTADEDFIMGYWDSKTLVAGGFSGHGFKFVPLIGKMVCDMLERGDDTQIPLRFKHRLTNAHR
ncbi:MAG: FAD-dependent oxidoreductase [Bernardetiaceae bacterium]|nr:FAD-dependent oxidoreductase [Bernardetiaceae bacterium]